MIRTIVSVSLCIVILSSFNKIRISKALPVQKDCKSSWEYFSLKDSAKGRVLFHAKAPFGCGILATASLTIVITDKNDTIRVLWLCNSDVVFKRKTLVKIFPEKKPSYGVLFPYKKSKYDCSIKKSCYGSIEKAE